MGKCPLIALLVLSLFSSSFALAGDEDKKTATPAVQPIEPEPLPLPPEPEAPDMSLGEEMEEPVSGPAFEPEEEEPEPVAAPAPRKARPPWDPDRNIDYSELSRLVTPVEVPRGVLAPALGFRGYRPNMIAVSLGDRTPGYGALVEYSWNRLAAGAFFSYRNLKDSAPDSAAQGVAGLYGLYRWLPFDFSPYLLAGLEIGSATPESFGGALGLGMEARVYSGWTILLGYTYHSTVRKGFLGGAFGWSF